MDFLKNFKCKGRFLSSLLDTLLSTAFRDVFSGSVAQSVQELWPIKLLRPLLWPTLDLRVFIKACQVNLFRDQVNTKVHKL